MRSRAITITSPAASRRPRSLSLALIVPRPPLLTLPSEVALHIFYIALQDNKVTNLGLVCKAIYRVIITLIYQTVLLNTSRGIQLFHRTITTEGSAGLSTNVKALIITSALSFSQPSSTHQLLLDIISHCSGVRTLALPSFGDITLAAPTNACSVDLRHTARPEIGHPSKEPLQLTLQSFHTFTPQYLQSRSGTHANSASVANFSGLSRFRTITHLRFCEPSEFWYSPLEILMSFGELPHLSHLQLCRRSEANEDNDVTFMEELEAILQKRKSLKMLVVSIFSPNWSGDQSVLTSSIWKALGTLVERDERVYRLAGKNGEWKNQWEGHRLKASPANFWQDLKVDCPH